MCVGTVVMMNHSAFRQAMSRLQQGASSPLAWSDVSIPCQSAHSEGSLFEIPVVPEELLLPSESAPQAAEPSHLEQSLRR